MSLAVYADDYDCASKTFLAFFAPVTSSQQFLSQRPYQTFSYQYSSVGGGMFSYCGGTYTFPVDDVSKYRVVMRNGEQCATVVQKQSATEGAGEWKAIDLVRRDQATPLFSDGGFCSPSKGFAGSSLLVTPRGT